MGVGGAVGQENEFPSMVDEALEDTSPALEKKRSGVGRRWAGEREYC